MSKFINMSIAKSRLVPAKACHEDIFNLNQPAGEGGWGVGQWGDGATVYKIDLRVYAMRRIKPNSRHEPKQRPRDLRVGCSYPPYSRCDVDQRRGRVARHQVARSVAVDGQIGVDGVGVSVGVEAIARVAVGVVTETEARDFISTDVCEVGVE